MSASFRTRARLAEMLLDLRFHSKPDKFRKRHPYSRDMAETQTTILGPTNTRREKVQTYRKWLESFQPCIFGRIAAKNKNVFICLIEEHEILNMKGGDDDLKDTIQDFRQAWKRWALDGFSSSFLIVLASPSIVLAEPGNQLKEIARRLMELYMEIPWIQNDTFHVKSEYVFLRRKTADGKKEILKFSTLPNIFCAQGDGRWWQDHRTPGGLMITSNALGHFMYSRTTQPTLQDKDKRWALENAMRTIHNAHQNDASRGSKKLKHCPATFLLSADGRGPAPRKQLFDASDYSTDHYEGYFHTDYLIPSAFFRSSPDPAHLKLYKDLTFRYIYDPVVDPEEHAELMTGVKADPYEVRRSMDSLPLEFSPETRDDFPKWLRAKVAAWLEDRIKRRLQP
jgi:hypothetical protein